MNKINLRQVTYKKKITRYECNKCKGTGILLPIKNSTDYEVERCDICNGIGKIEFMVIY